MKKIIITTLTFICLISYSQSDVSTKIDNFLDDMVIYTDNFTSKPLRSLSIQNTNSWIQSPKLKEKWKFNLAEILILF